VLRGQRALDAGAVADGDFVEGAVAQQERRRRLRRCGDNGVWRWCRHLWWLPSNRGTGARRGKARAFMHTVETVLLVLLLGAVTGIVARYLRAIPLPLI